MRSEEAGVLFGQLFHGLLFDELNAQGRGVPNFNMTVDDDALGQATAGRGQLLILSWIG